MSDLGMQDSEGSLPSYQRLEIYVILPKFSLFYTICVNWPNKISAKPYLCDWFNYFSCMIARRPKQGIWDKSPMVSKVLLLVGLQTFLLMMMIIVWIFVLCCLISSIELVFFHGDSNYPIWIVWFTNFVMLLDCKI